MHIQVQPLVENFVFIFNTLVKQRRIWWQLVRLRSEHTSHLRENQNKEKELFLKVTSSWTFSCNASCRSSRPEEFCKRDIFRSFAKLIGKRMCQSRFFNKACNFIKKETKEQVFSFKLCDISKNTFFHRTPLLLLLSITAKILESLGKLDQWMSTFLMTCNRLRRSWAQTVWTIRRNLRKIRHAKNIRSSQYHEKCL